MNFARFLLILNGVAFFGYGFACLVAPSLPAEYAGLELSTVSGTVEVVAMYGGLQAGIGALLLVGAMRSEQQRNALLVLAVVTGSLATARTFGIGVHGSSAYNVGALAYETLTAVLAVVALRGRAAAPAEVA